MKYVGARSYRAAMHHERAEHVHVCLTGRWSEDCAPGLLLEWRQRERVGWEGWVIVAEAGQRAGQVFARQSWVPASAIRRVSG